FVALAPFWANERNHFLYQRRTNALFSGCQVGTICHASAHDFFGWHEWGKVQTFPRISAATKPNIFRL
ncbi:hypothetical protein, partial [Thiothrix nivea]|uniref:hypothetical protein n=1 Tax=Thiothrix nivea TaxID=1031 RepID=UPI001B7F93E2